MLTITVHQSDIDQIKFDLCKTLSSIKSSHRVEAIARGLGFRSNAALRAALKINAIIVSADQSAFVSYLHSHGFEDSGIGFMRACAKIAIQQTMLKLPDVTYFGMGMRQLKNKMDEDQQCEFQERRELMLSDSAAGEFLLAYAFVSKLTKRKTLNRAFTSYGLKHEAERYFSLHIRERQFGHGYIANGVLIAAAAFAEFQVKVTDPGSPNVYFNIATPSLQALVSSSE